MVIYGEHFNTIKMVLKASICLSESERNEGHFENGS